MWRQKQKDLELIESFIEDLTLFKELKELRWEKIDEDVQRANCPGIPVEDWIPPPDEEIALVEFQKDPDYVNLRGRLEQDIPKLQAIARYVTFNAHHDFDWIIFTTPLIGNEALEDGLKIAQKLLRACHKKNYVFASLRDYLRFQKFK